MSTTATHTEREEFVLRLARYRPQTESRHIQRLMRYASGYERLKRKQLGQSLSLRDQLKMQRIATAISGICKEIDCEPELCGSVFLSVETGDFYAIVKVPCA